MPTTFLVLSVIGFALTANARFPRSSGSLLAGPSFFAAWPTTELAPQFLVVQAVGAVVLVWAGAVDGAAGLVALALTLVSWAGLVAIARQAARSSAIVERALADGLGAGYGGGLGPVHDATAQRALSMARLALAMPLPDRRYEKIRNLDYVGDGARRHRLDVYRPATETRGAPVVVQIHGGGWMIGDKREQGLPLLHHLAAHGWVGVAANYRLSPRVAFPDHLVDVKRVLAWVRDHIADYGGDPRFVAITGGSAGGHLAALAALTANDARYQPGFEHVDTSVVACVPFYGVYDFTGRFGGRGPDGFSGLVERLVFKQKVADAPDVFAQASPLEQVRPDAPPFMVVHGTSDALVPCAAARAFAGRLREVSTAPTVFVELPGAQHAFEVFHSVRSEAVVRGVHRFLAFVRAARQGSTAF